MTDGESREIDSAISPDSRWGFYDSTNFDGRQWRLWLRRVGMLEDDFPMQEKLVPTLERMRQSAFGVAAV